MKIVIDYNGSVAKCLVDGKPISNCDVLTRTMALGSFGTIKKHLERENLDLGKISPKYLDYIKSWLDYIEEGNRESFKDVFYLKMFIKNYSKYLGLDYDEMVEEFNEYLFDFTSKISIEDIKKAEKEQRKKEKKLKTVKIASPYTVEKQQQKTIPKFLIIGV